jgi:hypothetical protein
MKEEEKSIIKPLENELLNPSLDLGIDYAEMGLDAILDNDVLKEIPIVKSAVGLMKIGISLKERHDLKKILVFLSEFQKCNIEENQLKEFKENFSTDTSYRSKVIETITLVNERFLDIRKSKVLANLVSAHVEGYLTWSELSDLSIVLNNIHPKGFDFLHQMSKEVNWANHGRDQDGEPLLMACGVGHRHGTKFSVRKMGQDLYNFGVMKLYLG